jgi:streptogramin lyase
MESVLRFWVCAMCGRSTETFLVLDGTDQCEHCAEPTQFRNHYSRRGGRSAALILALVGASLTGIARGQVVTEFPVLTASSQPAYIAAAPDGNLWFTEFVGNNIGRITTAGVVTEFPGLTASSGPYGIAVGPDGDLWFAEFNANNIGRMTTAGVVTEFPIPTVSSTPYGITAGPDGNLWFTETVGNNVGRITGAGVIKEFSLGANRGPYGIAAGPDGNLWFAELTHNKIGRMTTAGVVTEFSIPTPTSAPIGITAGPDGNLWFTEYNGNKIGRITTAGSVTEFPVPTASAIPAGIAAGPDGNLWFGEGPGNNIGRITTAGVITEFPVLTPTSQPAGIAAGPDGNLWFTEYNGNNIGRITAGSLTPQPVAADAHAQSGSSSNLNGVLEPGETVQVAPSWKNTLTTAQGFTGTATDLTGPAGPTYTIHTATADYGHSVAGGATQDCNTATGDCYLMSVSGARPGAEWDVTFTETLNISSVVPDSIVATRTLHVGESFPDVPSSNQFYAAIENLFHNGITGGCAGGDYCPGSSVTRAQMAVFLMKSKLGKGEVPPPATGTVFSDVPVSNSFAPWIEQLAGFGITGGCGGGDYCPSSSVTRAQMAVFLLKTQHGSLYTPPACTGIFSDVPCPSQFANWIEQLSLENVTGGCGSGMYCPNNPVNRGQMAVFLVKVFGLQLN